MLHAIWQEVLDILSAVPYYLPGTQITIGIVIFLAILTYFRGRLGFLLFFIIVTVLIATSFFSAGDFYSMTFERVIAGVLLGGVILFTDLYFLVTTFADWR